MDTIFIHVLWCCMILVTSTKCQNANVFEYDLEHYLTNQMNGVVEKVKTAGNIISKRGLATIEADVLKNETFAKNYASNVYMFSSLNRSFIFMGNELYKIINNGESFEIKEPTSFPVDSDISFVRAIDFEGQGLLSLTLNDGVTHIYGLSSQTGEYRFVHSFLNAKPKDAILFIQNNRLYFAVCSSEGTISTATLYIWKESHFDQIQKIFSQDSSALASFPYRDVEIIILLRAGRAPNRYSTVFETSNNGLHKLQSFKTLTPDHMLHYVLGEEKYLVIFGEETNHTLYWWSGYELVQWMTFSTEYKVQKSAVIYFGDLPVILTIENNTITSYKLSEEGISLQERFHYAPDYIEVLEIKPINFNSQTNAVFITDSTKDSTRVNIYNFTASVIVKYEQKRKEPDALLQCLSNLEFKIEKSTDLRKIRARSTKATEDLVEQFAHGNISENDTASAFRSSKGHNMPPQFEKLSDEIAAMTTDLENRVFDMKEKVDALNDTSEVLIINSDSFLNGTIKANKLFGSKVRVERLNDYKWMPEQWLSYKTPQVINAPVSIRMLNTNFLKTKNTEVFEDLLLKNGNQVITGPAKLDSLTASTLNMTSINKIPIEEIYMKSKPGIIKGKKRFEYLNVQEAAVKSLNNKPVKEILNNYIDKYNGNLQVENLIVERIDNISWKDFNSTVFKSGTSDVIEGNLIFKTLRADELQVQSLNNVSVDDFFTTSTNQTILSSIQFRNIYSNDLKMNMTNGISLSKAAAIANKNTTVIIKGPVEIDNATARNLLVRKEAYKELFLKENKTIIGNKQSDLFQIYGGKVTVKGDLIVKNLHVPPSAKLFVDNKRIPSNILENYWTKSTAQVIPVYIEAQKGAITPQLITAKINNVLLSDFMLNSVDYKKPSRYYFENITVLGNVYLNPNEWHTPNLTDIAKKSVKTKGTFEVNGKKTFSDILEIDELEATNLDSYVIENSLIKSSLPLNISGMKAFQSLIVSENFTTNIHKTHIINEVFLEDLKNTTLRTDEINNIGNMSFENVVVEDLQVTNWNDQNVTEYIKALEEYNANKIKDLHITGNMTLRNAKNVTAVNNIPASELMNDEIQDLLKGIINRNVKFTGKTHVDNLLAKTINNVYLPQLLPRLLYKKWDQNITADYTFNSIEADNVKTPKINSFGLEDLIDITNKSVHKLPAKKGLRFQSTVNFVSLHSENLPCEIQNFSMSLNIPSKLQWETMVINGNVTFLDQEGIIQKIINKAVRNNGQNVIEKPVTFTQNVDSENIITKHPVNNIHIEKLIEDAVLEKYPEEQIISGRKLFNVVAASEMIVDNNLDIPYIKDFYIPEIQKSIVPKNDIHNITIRGHKIFFGGLQTKKLYVSKVSNIIPEKIVDQNKLIPIPGAVFDFIKVTGNLTIHHINDIDFKKFLNNRLLCNSTEEQIISEPYFFNELELRGKTNVKIINGIPMENIVFDKKLQNIQSSKRFIKDLEIDGNLKINYLNGKDLSKYYKDAIISGKNVTIDGDITIKRPSLVKSTIQVKSINGIPIEYLTGIMKSEKAKSSKESSIDVVDKIIDAVKDDLELIKSSPNELMYIERSSDIQLTLSNTKNAQVLTIGDHTLLHIIAEESGSFCGLPEECICPVQQTASVSPENSVHTFFDKKLQRFYSYDDNIITIHILTNSISSSEKCRTENSVKNNEASSLSWSVKPIKNNTGSFFLHPEYLTGYISGVEFFSLNGQTYIVVAKYYDPTLNTKKLNCMVLKFNENKTSIHEIQQIPTNGAWTLHIFQTAQGVILIIGNVKDMKFEEDENTEIFRFDPNLDKFIFLREIPSYGSIAAVGAVFGADSAIVLAHKEAPLQILKYQSQFENYYFYQSFQYSHPVIGISVFYSGDFGKADAYLNVVTQNSNYYIYMYKFIEGWVLESSGELDGLKSLIPFKLQKNQYLFAPSSKASRILSVIHRGS